MTISKKFIASLPEITQREIEALRESNQFVAIRPRLGMVEVNGFKKYRLKKEKNPGARRHTKKFDRCVKDVKRKGNATNAYAVCNAALKNPAGAYVIATTVKGKTGYFTGSKFDTLLDHAKVYARNPSLVLHNLRRKYKGIRFKIARVKARNPVGVLPTREREAEHLYKEFSGNKPDWKKKVKVTMPRVALAFGELDAVEYTTVRDGEVEAYRHEFKKRARPALAVGGNGKQLLILGGSYTFTDRGIEDE